MDSAVSWMGLKKGNTPRSKNTTEFWAEVKYDPLCGYEA
jgi:hypothetical protein